MSTCISRHGEYSDHEYALTGEDRFVCQRCFDFCAMGMLDEIDRLTQELDAAHADRRADGGALVATRLDAAAKVEALQRQINELTGALAAADSLIRSMQDYYLVGDCYQCGRSLATRGCIEAGPGIFLHSKHGPGDTEAAGDER